MKLRIEYGSDHCIVDVGNQPQDPILVDGVNTGRQLADASCRLYLVALIAAKICWPEDDWPEWPDSGKAIVPTEAWDALSYDVVDEDENVQKRFI